MNGGDGPELLSPSLVGFAVVAAEPAQWRCGRRGAGRPRGADGGLASGPGPPDLQDLFSVQACAINSYLPDGQLTLPHQTKNLAVERLRQHRLIRTI